MFKFVPSEIVARVLGQEARPSAVSITYINGAFDQLLKLFDVVDPGLLKPKARSALRGHLFWEGPLLVLALADALRTAPGSFPELENPTSVADELEAGLTRSDALYRLGNICIEVGKRCVDFGARERSTAVATALDIMRHDRALSGAGRRRRSVITRRLDPDRERVLRSARSIVAAWQRRLRGR